MVSIIAGTLLKLILQLPFIGCPFLPPPPTYERLHPSSTESSWNLYNYARNFLLIKQLFYYNSLMLITDFRCQRLASLEKMVWRGDSKKFLPNQITLYPNSTSRTLGIFKPRSDNPKGQYPWMQCWKLCFRDCCRRYVIIHGSLSGDPKVSQL